MTGHSSDPSIDVDKQRPEAARLAERCIAYKGQVEAGAAEIARLTAERDDALALAAKLNGGEELQSLMSLNNRLTAELAGLRIERDALKGEVSDVCEIANNVKAALSRAEKALKEIDDLPSVQQDEGPMIARRALLSISEPVK